MSKSPRHNEGIRAVLRWFPSEARLIEELSSRNENFRDMCNELADAELGLRATRDAPPEVREGENRRMDKLDRSTDEGNRGGAEERECDPVGPVEASRQAPVSSFEASLTHFEIHGDDPAKLAAFYSSLFGWRHDKAQGVDYWRIEPGRAPPPTSMAG